MLRGMSRDTSAERCAADSRARRGEFTKADVEGSSEPRGWKQPGSGARAAQREAGLAGSAFRPNLYTGSGVAYTNGFPLLAGGGAPAVFNLSYSQQIFNPPLRGDQRAAQQRAEGQRFSMDGVRDGVMVRAALEYLELGKVRHALELMRNERLSASHILDATRERSEAGRELPIEVTKAQLTSAKIEQRIAQMEDRDDALSGELRDMMGVPEDQAIEVSSDDFPAAAVDASKDLVAQAMANNVELKQAETEKRAREEKLKGEHGGYWPTFSLIGQYNVLSKINNYTDFFNKFQRNNVIFGLQVQVPIFASRTTSAVAFARADLNAANLALENKRSQLSLDVRRKVRQVRESDLGREVARLELQVAQENVRVLQAQFDQGRGSLTDLEAAHLDENDKWLAYLDANYARQQAQLDLLRTTGQLSTALQ
jgi:outer membrane protein